MILKLFLIALSCFIGYILGSFNFAIFISKKFYNQNIKNLGSKNAGMTNVLRNFGKTPAIITLIGDSLKGAISILICHLIAFKSFNPLALTYLKYFVLISALLGHIFPIFYNFKGGKGILVVAGALILIDLKVFLTLVTIFIIILKFSKIISLCSLFCAISFPIVNFFTNYFSHKVSTRTTLAITFISTIISIILIFKHKDNIKRLIEQKEPKIGK